MIMLFWPTATARRALPEAHQFETSETWAAQGFGKFWTPFVGKDDWWRGRGPVYWTAVINETDNPDYTPRRAR